MFREQDLKDLSELLQVLSEGQEVYQETVDNKLVDGVFTQSVTLESGETLEVHLDVSGLVESLGQLIDLCDNYSSLGNNAFMPQTMKIDALLHGIKGLRGLIFDTYSSLGGEDHWGGQS